MKRLFLLLTVVGVLFTARATAQTNNIQFKEGKIKQFCTLRWDTNSDYELSYDEAAAVTNLDYAFKGKDISMFNELKYFTGLKSIERFEFKDCISLSSIIIPNSVISIGETAFAGCTSLTDIVIPDSVTKIGKEAFARCSSLASVTIGNSVTSIEAKAFYACTSLKEVYYTGDLSAWCKINIGHFGSPLNAEAKLYINDTEQTDITIPSDITAIKDFAFFTCASLKSVTIPASVTSIGANAFSYCKGLTKVYFKSTTPPTIHPQAFNGNVPGRRIYVPRSSVEAYKSATGWSMYAKDIEGYDF